MNKDKILFILLMAFLVSISIIATQYPTTESPNLKEIVAAQYPEMKDENIDDWTRVNLIREFVAQTVDIWGEDGATAIDNVNYSAFYNSDATELYTLFNTDQGGVFCGGTAYTLMRFYNYYGYEAYVIHNGVVPNFTHAITIVNISHNDNYIFSVQDAFLDETYTKSNGGPVDYFEMLYLLKNRTPIRVQEGTNEGRDFHIYKTGDISRHCVITIDRDVDPIILENTIKYHGSLTTENIFNNSCCGSFVSFIKDEGYSSPLSLYLYPFLVLDTNWKMDNKLLIKARNISNPNYAL